MKKDEVSLKPSFNKLDGKSTNALIGTLIHSSLQNELMPVSIKGRGAKRIKASKGVVAINSHDANNGSNVKFYKEGVLIASVYVTKRGGYKYLQTLKRSKHFKDLERQLIRHSVTLSDCGLGIGGGDNRGL